jgi:hypothetical protein
MVSTQLAETRRYLHELDSKLCNDPEPLREAARTYRRLADQAGNVRCDTDMLGAESADVWVSWAADAFRGKTALVSWRLDAVTGPVFTETAIALESAAAALARSRGSIVDICRRFDVAAADYEARAARTAGRLGSWSLYFEVLQKCAWWRSAGSRVVGSLSASLISVAERLDVLARYTQTESEAFSIPPMPGSAGEFGAETAGVVRRALDDGVPDHVLRFTLAPLRSTVDRIRSDLLSGKPISAYDQAMLTGFYDPLGPELLKIPGVLQGEDLKWAGNGLMLRYGLKNTDGLPLRMDWVDAVATQPVEPSWSGDDAKPNLAFQRLAELVDAGDAELRSGFWRAIRAADQPTRK